MQLDTVIFDMDGLLIDSEPLWDEAAAEVFGQYGIEMNEKQFSLTTGLRTKEFVEWWFSWFKIDRKFQQKAGEDIVEKVIDKILNKGRAQPGLEYILNFFTEKSFKIGLASSSPMNIIDVAIDFLGIRKYLKAISSASELRFGKPHPEVYLNCAEELNSSPANCISFEDSFNGLISAKAARMKCVVVPAKNQLENLKWIIADFKITSLQNFDDLMLLALNEQPDK